MTAMPKHPRSSPGPAVATPRGALGKARLLSESLATLESVLGIDLRSLTKSIAGNIAGDGKNGGTPSLASKPAV